MGDVKFVPNLEQATFAKIINASNANQTHNAVIQSLWERCKHHIFSLTEGTTNLGFFGEGVTTYFSDNCTREDSKLVNDWMKSKKYEGYIARTFKQIASDGRATYEIKIASVEDGPKAATTVEPEEFKGATFRITRGDHSKWLALANRSLEQALNYAANDNEVNALKEYIKSFTEGDLEAHKEATRYIYTQLRYVYQSLIAIFVFSDTF